MIASHRRLATKVALFKVHCRFTVHVYYPNLKIINIVQP